MVTGSAWERETATAGEKSMMYRTGLEQNRQGVSWMLWSPMTTPMGN